MSQDQILSCIYEAIDTLNESREASEQIAKSTDTVLFGKDGGLDSLGLVNLIVTVEQNVSDAFGVEVTLADERAMSMEDSPFHTVNSLKDYIGLLLNETA